MMMGRFHERSAAWLVRQAGEDPRAGAAEEAV